VIAPASLASAKAAETLREDGFDGPVVLVGAEPERPRLLGKLGLGQVDWRHSGARLLGRRDKSVVPRLQQGHPPPDWMWPGPRVPRVRGPDRHRSRGS